MRARHIIIGIAGVSLAVTAGTAHADSVSISLDRVIVGPPGSVTIVATRSLDASMAGATCSAAYTGQNNGSVHPDTDLLVASGSSQLVLGGVEDAAGLTTTGSGQLLLGSDVTVSVRLGGDGVASLGASLTLTCTPVAPTTTATPTTAAPTTAAPGTTAPATTTAPTNPAAPPTTATVDAGVASSAVTTTIVASAGPVVGPTAAPMTTRAAGPAALPATGSSHDRLVQAALALLLTGGLLCLSRRRAVPGEGR
jgi:hypothetical protein